MKIKFFPAPILLFKQKGLSESLLKHSRAFFTYLRSFLDASWQFSRKIENSRNSGLFWWHEKKCGMIFSAPRNRFEDLITPNWSYYLFVGSGSFLENSVDWALRFSRLKGAKNTNNLLTRFFSFSRRPYYSSRQKGFPSHFFISELHILTFSDVRNLHKHILRASK